MEKIEKRDIVDYEKNYSNAVCGFEKYKVFYRKRKIVEIIEQYSPQSILEIGCGMEPLFCYVKGDQKFTIVEPAEKFCENAKQLSVENKNVTCIKGFLKKRRIDCVKHHLIWLFAAVCCMKSNSLKNF